MRLALILALGLVITDGAHAGDLAAELTREHAHWSEYCNATFDQLPKPITRANLGQWNAFRFSMCSEKVPELRPVFDEIDKIRDELHGPS